MGQVSSHLLHSTVHLWKEVHSPPSSGNPVHIVILKLLKFFASFKVSGVHLKAIFWPISMRITAGLEKMRTHSLVPFRPLILMQDVMQQLFSRTFNLVSSNSPVNYF